MLVFVVAFCLFCPGWTELCLPCEPCVSACDLDDLFSSKSVGAVSAETGFSERELSTLSLYNPGLIRRYSLGQMSAGSFVSEADVRRLFISLIGIFSTYSNRYLFSTLTQLYWILFQFNFYGPLWSSPYLYSLIWYHFSTYSRQFEYVILLGIFFSYFEAQLPCTFEVQA